MGRWNDEETSVEDRDETGRLISWASVADETGDGIVRGAPALRALIEKAQAELARLVELEKIEARPAEPVSDYTGSTVIRFHFQYSGRGRVYAFAAFRENGKWYVTGNGAPGRGISWSALWEWIEGAGTLVGPMYAATDWQPIS